MEGVKAGEGGVEGGVGLGRGDGNGGDEDGLGAEGLELSGESGALVTGAGDEDAFGVEARHLWGL